MADGTTLTVRELIVALLLQDLDAEVALTVYNSDPINEVSIEADEEGRVILEGGS